jgi:hypothetical protein
MSHFSVNISNIVLTYEQYCKVKAYAKAHKTSIHEAIQLIIDSLPKSQYNKNLNNNYPFLFSRRILHILFNVK